MTISINQLLKGDNVSIASHLIAPGYTQIATTNGSTSDALVITYRQYGYDVTDLPLSFTIGGVDVPLLDSQVMPGYPGPVFDNNPVFVHGLLLPPAGVQNILSVNPNAINKNYEISVVTFTGVHSFNGVNFYTETGTDVTVSDPKDANETLFAFTMFDATEGTGTGIDTVHFIGQGTEQQKWNTGLGTPQTGTEYVRTYYQTESDNGNFGWYFTHIGGPG